MNSSTSTVRQQLPQSQLKPSKNACEFKKKKKNLFQNNKIVKYIKRKLLVKNIENIRKGLCSCSSNEHWKDLKSFFGLDYAATVVLVIFNKNVDFIYLLLFFSSHLSHCV